jgi:hypothetical protein
MKQRSNIARFALAAFVGFTAVCVAQNANAADNEHHHAAASAWENSQFRASQSGPYPEEVEPNGMITGPIARDVNGG